MNPLYEAALEVQGFLQAHGWESCIIGGLAVVRWGRPRATQDVDMTLLTGIGAEESYIRPILGRFRPRREDAEQFAIDCRVLLIEASNGVTVDMSLAGFQFEERVVERASAFEFEPGVSLVTCSAEDLVVLKCFAGRALDWADVESVAVRQRAALDWGYVEKQLAELSAAIEEADFLHRLRRLREELSEEPGGESG